MWCPAIFFHQRDCEEFVEKFCDAVAALLSLRRLCVDNTVTAAVGTVDWDILVDGFLIFPTQVMVMTVHCESESIKVEETGWKFGWKNFARQIIQHTIKLGNNKRGISTPHEKQSTYGLLEIFQKAVTTSWYSPAENLQQQNFLPVSFCIVWGALWNWEIIRRI